MDRNVMPSVPSARTDGPLTSSSREAEGIRDIQPSQIDGPPRYRSTSQSALHDFATSARGFPSAVSATATAAATATITITEEEEDHEGTSAPPEVLTLTLRPRPSVRWDENVIDNEGMSRKSSKRCCIFHKQREFGESSTDSSDQDDDDDHDFGDSDGDDSGTTPRGRRIARPKKGGAVPDFQRFHA